MQGSVWVTTISTGIFALRNEAANMTNYSIAKSFWCIHGYSVTHWNFALRFVITAACPISSFFENPEVGIIGIFVQLQMEKIENSYQLNEFEYKFRFLKGLLN